MVMGLSLWMRGLAIPLTIASFAALSKAGQAELLRVAQPRLQQVQVSQANPNALRESTSAAVFPFSDRGKFGLINRQGQVIVPPQFDTIGCQQEGLIAVEVGAEQGPDGTRSGKWGFINYQGQMVISPQFAFAGCFDQGRAFVLLPAIEQSAQQRVFIDPTGRVVILPAANLAGVFSEGRLLQVVNDRWGYVDQEGQTVIPPQFQEAREFSEGLAAVKVGDRWGYINPSGQMVILPRFTFAAEFSEGLAAVSLDPAETYPQMRLGFIDSTGKLVIAPQLIGINACTGEGPEFSEDRVAIYSDRRTVFLDRQGQTVIQLEGYASNFSEGLAVVWQGDRAGYMTPDGKFAITPQFLNAYPFKNGLAAVRVPAPPNSPNSEQTWGYIDRQGNFVWPPRYGPPTIEQDC